MKFQAIHIGIWQICIHLQKIHPGCSVHKCSNRESHCSRTDRRRWPHTRPLWTRNRWCRNRKLLPPSFPKNNIHIPHYIRGDTRYRSDCLYHRLWPPASALMKLQAIHTGKCRMCLHSPQIPAGCSAHKYNIWESHCSRTGLKLQLYTHYIRTRNRLCRSLRSLPPSLPSYNRHILLHKRCDTRYRSGHSHHRLWPPVSVLMKFQAIHTGWFRMYLHFPH